MKSDYFDNCDIIVGRNPVMEAIKSDREIDRLLVAKGNRSGSLKKIVAMCAENNVLIKETDIKKLDSISEGTPHQGVAAFVSPYKYSSLDDIFSFAEEKNEPAFIIICDGIEDPYNLGAIIRSAECAGAHGIIIPKRRAAGLSSGVYKTSAGAVEHIKISKVSNLASTLEELKSRGVWIYAADMDGQDAFGTDFSGAAGLIIGSEGKGVSRLLKERADVIVSLPIKGQVDSLNASVAAGVLIYEVLRHRLKG